MARGGSHPDRRDAVALREKKNMSDTNSVTRESALSRVALRCCAWAERWFPDAWVFAVVMLALVAFAALAIGVKPAAVASSFGSGFWSLIPFTSQMAFVILGG